MRRKSILLLVGTFFSIVLLSFNFSSDMTDFASLRASYVNAESNSYPYYIFMPSIRARAPVVILGLEQDGKMAVPNNYKEASIYQYGSRPGEIGNTVIGAHVDDGAFRPGVFKNLKNLKEGDFVYLWNADGKQFSYKVTSAKIYDYKLRDTTEVFVGGQDKVIKLITCYGKWLSDEKTYDKRLVVTAILQ